MRGYLTSGGIICAWTAVGALFVLHLTWISPDISQRFGLVGVKILGQLIFWLPLTGLLLSLVGSGKSRWVGLVSCIGIGLWDFALIMSAAISMGAPIARHPTRFLIPAGYVGWVTVKYGGKTATPTNVEWRVHLSHPGIRCTSYILRARRGLGERRILLLLSYRNARINSRNRLGPRWESLGRNGRQSVK